MSRNHHLICCPHHAPKILDGTKTTTIRAPRKDGRIPVVGDTITFRKWIGRPYGAGSTVENVRVVTVTSVRKISVFRNGICWDVDIDRTSPSTEALRELAIGDGFEHITELVDYLTSDKQPEFSGFIYGWEP